MASKSINAIKMMLGLIGLVILFHLGILLKIIPYHIAWGGRLTNDQEMYVFEIISIVVNVLLLLVLLMKGRFIRFQFPPQVVRVVLWVFFFLFILNTIGNIFAQTWFEKSFAIVTLLLFSFLIWSILRDKPQQ